MATVTSEALGDNAHEDAPLSASLPVDARREIHLLDLLIVLSRRRRFIAWFTLAFSAISAATVFLLPSRYTAVAIVLPPMQNSSIGSALLAQLGGANSLASAAGATLGLKNPGELYASLFHCRTIEDAVIHRFGLENEYRKRTMSDARRTFESRSKIALGAKDGLITISYTDRDPTRASNIVNGYIDEYRKLSASLAITEASQRRAFFQQQLLEAKENLSEAEEAMKGMQQSTGVLQIDSQTRALIEAAAALRAQVVAKEVQVQGMRLYAAEDNPELLEAKQQLAALQAQLARLSGAGQNSGNEFIVPKNKVPEAELEYIRHLRDVKYYDTISELLARQLEMAKLDEARQGTLIQIVDAAVPPDKRSFPKRSIVIAVAIVLGFALACAWCGFVEMFRQMNANPSERRRLDILRATFR